MRQHRRHPRQCAPGAQAMHARTRTRAHAHPAAARTGSPADAPMTPSLIIHMRMHSHSGERRGHHRACMRTIHTPKRTRHPPPTHFTDPGHDVDGMMMIITHHGQGERATQAHPPTLTHSLTPKHRRCDHVRATEDLGATHMIVSLAAAVTRLGRVCFAYEPHLGRRRSSLGRRSQ